MMDASYNGSERIPTRIFQTWKRKEHLPPKCAYWRSTLLEKNRQFEFELWDDAENRKFIEENAPWFLPIYDSYPAEIYRVDMVRYFYLYLKGGFYIDLDTECLRPLDGFLSHPGIVLGRMGDDPDIENCIPNAIMASRPREEFWLLVIAMAMKRMSKRGASPEQLTGPILLKNALDAYLFNWRWLTSHRIRQCARLFDHSQQPRPMTSDILILPPHEWYPINWTNETDSAVRQQVLDYELLDGMQKQAMFPNSSLVTWWMHSW
jgi:inositol phosphorylceramide mannosyltransferase catalytic subunit